MNDPFPSGDQCKCVSPWQDEENGEQENEVEEDEEDVGEEEEEEDGEGKCLCTMLNNTKTVEAMIPGVWEHDLTKQMHVDNINPKILWHCSSLDKTYITFNFG